MENTLLTSAYSMNLCLGFCLPPKLADKAVSVSPEGATKNQIDYFCISKRFRGSQEDVVRKGADIGSDHHMPLANLKLCLKKQERNTGKSRSRFQEVWSSELRSYHLWIKLEKYVGNQLVILSGCHKMSIGLVSSGQKIKGKTRAGNLDKSQ
ncbi:hypothetical protein RRG08_037423 [Elysia crispata]|uniref:Uncharacterized protein n=1 Tax=Elysia crispata TaxID=231223 RepID=A0AAE1DZ67_9GAST|nr:hypothetical protein RRG08_037423 [Elysia crispata]